MLAGGAAALAAGLILPAAVYGFADNGRSRRVEKHPFRLHPRASPDGGQCLPLGLRG